MQSGICYYTAPFTRFPSIFFCFVWYFKRWKLSIELASILSNMHYHCHRIWTFSEKLLNYIDFVVIHRNNNNNNNKHPWIYDREKNKIKRLEKSRDYVMFMTFPDWTSVREPETNWNDWVTNANHSQQTANKLGLNQITEKTKFINSRMKSEKFLGFFNLKMSGSEMIYHVTCFICLLH